MNVIPEFNHSAAMPLADNNVVADKDMLTEPKVMMINHRGG
jgi:hypothetical protein